VDKHADKLYNQVDKPTNIEIELTTACNLHCFNCNRSCAQAPSNEELSLCQISAFITQSIKLRWAWNRISILGGEPMLHSHLNEVFLQFRRYKHYRKSCVFHFLTNGLIKPSAVPNWITVINSNKTSRTQQFAAYNSAPIDRGISDCSKGCWIPYNCGIGFSRYGFYPCGAGASIDRVFGFDVGKKTLEGITMNTLASQFSLLCKHCGHFGEMLIDGNIINRIITTEVVCSKSWIDAYKNYRVKKPVLRLYG
jgi:hypothetical protein